MKWELENARERRELLPSWLKKAYPSEKTESFRDVRILSLDPVSFLSLKGVSGKKAPVLEELCNKDFFLQTLQSFKKGESYLLSDNGKDVFLTDGKGESLSLPDKEKILSVIRHFDTYGGELLKDGSQVLDLTLPDVGVHYGVNLLLGDRTGFSDPLQATPKSVTTRFGGGSFRAQAGYQVLATSWGISPEENGHPANRQFYLIEDGKQIFYSGAVLGNTVKMTTTNKANVTKIDAEIKEGLKIRRTIFLSPQEKGLPDAIEIQTIQIENLSSKKRDIRIVYTGMFGFSNPDCQKEDVIYSTVVSQGQILSESGKPIAYVPHYYAEYFKRQKKFVVLKDDEGFFDSISTSYYGFLNGGDLSHPAGLLNLDNALSLKGPNFFALGKCFSLAPLGKENIDTFTGSVDALETKGDGDEKKTKEQIANLLSFFKDHDAVEKEEKKVKQTHRDYCRFLQIEEAKDPYFQGYMNSTLPFQVRYQTFVSRSFAMTQKGYRETGFREIQDLYASIYYFLACGKKEEFVMLLSSWIENVFEFGYVNHNFFYVGKEPGMCSDDGLWLLPLVYKYILLTGDKGILSSRFRVAGSEKKRSLYETLKAILLYSGWISVGRHQIPLLDRADWNDCLRIDPDYLDGPEKEKAYYKQIEEKKQPFGTPLESDYSESVMNGFLLSINLKDMAVLSGLLGKEDDRKKYLQRNEELEASLHRNAFQNGYYCRVLINRKNEKNSTYIGSRGDGLSLSEEIDGSYYLNSFSWAVLSGVATEEEKKSMLPIVDRYLKCPAGFRLCTISDLSRAGAKDSATDHYYPGDRENGGVFKHAMMMSLKAFLCWEKEEKDPILLSGIGEDIDHILSVTLPYKTLEHPEKTKGNPRFCTQYNNSLTEENIGPVLSGTATWLTLCLVDMLGLAFVPGGFRLSPLVPVHFGKVSYSVILAGKKVEVRISDRSSYEKPSRIKADGKESGPLFSLDDIPSLIEIQY